MSEQDNGLQLAVNNLATEMRRANYLNAIGIGGGNTKRPTLYQEFGYPRTITFNDFYNMYRRNAAGFAVVHRLLDGCWQDYPVIVDGDEAQEAEKTNAWEKKVTKFMKKLWPKVKDADRRNMVGRYSALLLQVKDNKSWNEPVDTKLVKSLGESALVKLIPVWEPQLTVAEWDNDRQSETFGQPKMFNFNEQPVGDEAFVGPMRGEPVHPSRVILFCEGSEDDNVLSGIPLLEAGFNKGLDIEKISGGGAEGFLKNASRQIAVEFSKETDMNTLADQAKKAGYADLGEAMGDKVNKLNRGTDAAAVMQAGQMHVLSVTPGDPGPTGKSLLTNWQPPCKSRSPSCSVSRPVGWRAMRIKRTGLSAVILGEMASLRTGSPRCWSASGRLGLSTRRPKARSPFRGVTCWRPARKRRSRTLRNSLTSCRKPRLTMVETRRLPQMSCARLWGLTRYRSQKNHQNRTRR